MSLASLHKFQLDGVAPRGRLLLAFFTATIFLSALLLFVIEPMFAKMTLPALGGSPAVWSVAMVFFQAMMFAGYCYAFALTRFAPPKLAFLIHAAVLAAAIVCLPLQLRTGGAPPTEGSPAFWLIGVFTLSIGLPFFALSAHSPLLQAWFARSGHPRAHDPYFLYGASNIGSFVALLAYPFAIEPFVGLKAQAGVWTAAFVALALMILLCAATAKSAPHVDAPARISRVEAGALPRWIALAFVPSALLVSATAHVSTDIAAAPLLWVLPLALYLLTFVLTFRSQNTGGGARWGALQSWLAAIVLMEACIGMFPSAFISLAIHLGLFFINAMVCHAALYRQRPSAVDLTIFYAAMSFGGALGGLFAGLLAPLVFSSVVEYPLLIAAALFCRPGAFAELRALDRSTAMRTLAVAAAMPVFAVAILFAVRNEHAPAIAAILIGGSMLLVWRAPGRIAVFGVAAVACVLATREMSGDRESYRSFFGVHRVETTRDGQFRTLAHGFTMHGAIRVREADGSPAAGRPDPATYYALNGPIGEAIAAARVNSDGRLRHAAFIGLGAGALACHVRDDEAATFYEIDPLVIHLARDSGRFRYVSACAPQARFVAGDARLTLAEQEGKSDVIVVDAFSSDAIPVHLLTREAFELYQRKLTPEGLLVVHISNKAMEFSGTIARIGAELGLATWVREDLNVDPKNSRYRTPSVAAVLARDPAHLNALSHESGAWKRVAPDMRSWPWTDDYSTILKAIGDMYRR